MHIQNSLHTGSPWYSLLPVKTHQICSFFSNLTHSYLLSGDNQPTCASCDLPLTIIHILLECPNLAGIRCKYFNVNISSRILFESVDNQNITDFIKDTHFYNLLSLLSSFYCSLIALILPHIFIFFLVIDYLYSLLFP